MSSGNKDVEMKDAASSKKEEKKEEVKEPTDTFFGNHTSHFLHSY